MITTCWFAMTCFFLLISGEVNSPTLELEIELLQQQAVGSIETEML